MTISISALTLGAIAGVGCSVAIIFPRIGRTIAQIFGTTAFAAGAGLLAWAFTASSCGDELTGILLGNIRIVYVSDAVGWGVALLTGGTVMLFFSFIGRSEPSDLWQSLRHSIGIGRSSRR
jgi:hypothetical protein